MVPAFLLTENFELTSGIILDKLSSLPLMRPVRILGFRKNLKATLNRNLILLIDNQPLVDLLEVSIPKDANISQWREKKDALVIIESLKQSIINPGKYDFLTCAHCAMPELL